MVHEFDAKKTEEFFNRRSDCFESFNSLKRPRDIIFLEKILPKIKEKNPNKIKAIEFGCGSGDLVLNLINMGIDCYGIEKHDELYEIAKKKLSDKGHENRIIKGGVEKLIDFEENSIDLVILMGVFQYLSPEDYEEILKNINKILKKRGDLIGSFQNAFFDLFTFNKYTLDFYKENLIKQIGIDKGVGKEIFKDLRNLITNPDEPDYSPNIARDNIYIRTTNPMTIGEEFYKKGYKLIKKYFYEFHFVPRLIEKKYENVLMSLAKDFEVKRATEWFGYFMANAFVVHFTKN